MSERKPGWYWVKQHDSLPWDAAQLKDGRWYVAGDDGWWGDEDFSNIGPLIPTPGEPWQYVPVEATPDMMEASGYGASIETLEAWFEMLAAAPKP